MRRPKPVCPMCGELGIHASADECLVALQAAIDARAPQAPQVEKEKADGTTR